jgi:hypothetical protein
MVASLADGALRSAIAAPIPVKLGGIPWGVDCRGSVIRLTNSDLNSATNEAATGPNRLLARRAFKAVCKVDYADLQQQTSAPTIRCPGQNTYEMRHCAEKSWEQSDAQLRQKVGKRLTEQWHETTKAVCSAAYAPYKDGTIYPQLVVGCDDRLNRAILKEFKPLLE